MSQIDLRISQTYLRCFLNQFERKMLWKWFFINLKLIWEGQNSQISLRRFGLKNFFWISILNPFEVAGNIVYEWSLFCCWIKTKQRFLLQVTQQAKQSNSRRSILVGTVISSHLSPDKHYTLLKYFFVTIFKLFVYSTVNFKPLCMSSWSS